MKDPSFANTEVHISCHRSVLLDVTRECEADEVGAVGRVILADAGRQDRAGRGREERKWSYSDALLAVR